MDHCWNPNERSSPHHKPLPKRNITSATQTIVSTERDLPSFFKALMMDFMVAPSLCAVLFPREQHGHREAASTPAKPRSCTSPRHYTHCLRCHINAHTSLTTRDKAGEERREGRGRAGCDVTNTNSPGLLVNLHSEWDHKTAVFRNGAVNIAA